MPIPVRYTATVSPIGAGLDSDTSDPKYHHLKVQLATPGTRVLEARSGYYPLTKVAAPAPVAVENSALRTKLDAANENEKRACANGTGGMACFNAAYIRAIGDVNLLPSFAKMVCVSGLTCHGQSDCEKS